MIFRPFFIPAPTFSTPQRNISTLQRLHASTFQHSYIFTFSFFIFHFLGVPLAASGFGSGYPLLLAAYKRLVLSLPSP